MPHGPPFVSANSNPNPKLSTAHLQSLVDNSKVSEKREVRHPAQLTKDIWRQKYQSANAKAKRGKVHYPHRHKLGPTWANIMTEKTWHTVGEAQLRLDVAAWHWLNVGSGIDTAEPKPIRSARFSKLMALGLCVRYTSTDTDDGDETRHQ